MVIIQINGEQLSNLIQDAVRQAIDETSNIQSTLATDELLTVQQAAAFLKLAVATIYAMVQRKELPVCKRGGRLYFSKAELIEYVKSGRKKTAAEITAEANCYLNSKKKGAKNA